jgi:hypothetical protein
MLAEEVRASFVVWNKERLGEPENSILEKRLDPNYLTRSQFGYSRFHQCLHKFV